MGSKFSPLRAVAGFLRQTRLHNQSPPSDNDLLRVGSDAMCSRSILDQGSSPVHAWLSFLQVDPLTMVSQGVELQQVSVEAGGASQEAK